LKPGKPFHAKHFISSVKFNEIQQRLLLADKACTIADDITSLTGNAMTKIWLAGTVPLSTTENGLLSGLQYSPVAFGSYVSNDIDNYSGGTWEDSKCESDANAHAMLLVGYTETVLRVKARLAQLLVRTYLHLQPVPGSYLGRFSRSQLRLFFMIVPPLVTALHGVITGTQITCGDQNGWPLAVSTKLPSL